MQYRCTGGFTYHDRVVAGGQLVDDSDPILATHPQCFIPVGEPPAPAGETASTDTVRRRGGRPKKSEAISTAVVPADEQSGDDAGTGA